MKREKVLETILVMAAGLLVFFFIFEDKWAYSKWLVIAALSLMVIAIASDFLGEKISWLWMKLAEFLGKVNGGILISLIFFLLLFPISVLYRMFGNDPLSLKKPEGSAYSERNHTYSAKDLKNPW